MWYSTKKKENSSVKIYILTRFVNFDDYLIYTRIIINQLPIIYYIEIYIQNMNYKRYNNNKSDVYNDEIETEINLSFT